MSKLLTPEQLIACGLEPATAAALLPPINHWLTTLPAIDCWQQLTRNLLTPAHPFALHHLLHQTTFADWPPDRGPAPAWFPNPKQPSHLADLMQQLRLGSYGELHRWSAQHRAEFWELMLQRLGIRLHSPYRAIVDLTEGIESPSWLKGGRLNIVESCFQAPEAAPAIVFQSAGGPLSTLTYGELRALANRVANGLVAADIRPGDAIAIALPMTAEAVAIYLGIILAGAVVVSIAESFAADAIAIRLQIARAKAIFTQDLIRRAGNLLPLYAKVSEANAPAAIVLPLQGELSVSLRAGDRSWQEFLSPEAQFQPIPAEPSAHTTILFSSGTTGEPKAIPWTHTTPIKSAADAYLHQDIHPGDRLAWPTSLGWMMGPWLVYASLINQATIALYDGAATDRGFGQFVQDAGVTMLGLVPSLVSAWRASHCMQGLDWSAIKVFSSTGECSNPSDMLFLMSRAGYKPIIEYCGGTEIGGAYLTGTVIQPCIPATFTTPALGLDVIILDETDRPADSGELFIIPPSIGLSTGLLNADHHQVYFANSPRLPLSAPLRRHGDQIERLPNGYYRSHGRVDDTMNLSGIKVSSVEIEQTLSGAPGIGEIAAIAVPPLAGGPNQLVLYVVLLPEAEPPPQTLKASLQATIAQHLNPLFKIHDLVIVEALPRTASNKVMRRVLRQHYRAIGQPNPSPNAPRH